MNAYYMFNILQVYLLMLPNCFKVNTQPNSGYKMLLQKRFIQKTNFLLQIRKSEAGVLKNKQNMNKQRRAFQEEGVYPETKQCEKEWCEVGSLGYKEY